jgi:hypothetical protein
VIVEEHRPLGEAESFSDNVDVRHQRDEVPCRAVIKSAMSSLLGV